MADFVRLPLERAGGMMNLIDIYCLFNRARGTGIFLVLLSVFLSERFFVGYLPECLQIKHGIVSHYAELISPEDLLQACVLWEKFDV